MWLIFLIHCERDADVNKTMLFKKKKNFKILGSFFSVSELIKLDVITPVNKMSSYNKC